VDEKVWKELQMINNAIIVGRLTRDPQVHQAGAATVVNFTVACDRNYKNQQGEKEADFIPVVAWRKTAEIIAKYANKGTLVAIQGYLQTRTYEKNGQKFFVMELICNEIQFLSPAQKDEVKEKVIAVGFDEIPDDEIALPF